MDSILVHFQVMFLPKCFSTLVTHMFLLAPMDLVDVRVETLVPAATEGAHLLLVEVRRLVVDLRLYKNKIQNYVKKKGSCLLLCSKHPLAIFILAGHRLFNSTCCSRVSRIFMSSIVRNPYHGIIVITNKECDQLMQCNGFVSLLLRRLSLFDLSCMLKLD